MRKKFSALWALCVKISKKIKQKIKFKLMWRRQKIMKVEKHSVEFSISYGNLIEYNHKQADCRI